MGFWPVLGIIVGVCLLIRILSGLFSEAPIVASVLAEILLIIELILVIQFKEFTDGLVSSIDTDKELLTRADWIYIFFIAIVLMSCAPILFDPDMDYLDSFDTEFGEIMVYLVGSPPFIGVLLGAAAIGALIVYAFHSTTFLIILIVGDMLWNGYLIYASATDSL